MTAKHQVLIELLDQCIQKSKLVETEFEPVFNDHEIIYRHAFQG